MLANELANRVFGENHATSVVARDKNGWKPTPAAVLDDIQNACVEHACAYPGFQTLTKVGFSTDSSQSEWSLEHPGRL